MARLTRRAFLVGVAATSLALSACGSDSLNTGTSSSGAAAPAASATVDEALAAKLPAKIKTAGKIVVGVDATYAPNEFLAADGTTVEGMDVDLFNAVAVQFGVPAEYVPAKFGDIILGVDSGKYDVGVSSFTINPERKKVVNMVSYFNAGTQWVTQKGNPKKVDPNAPCGLNIGVQKGTVQATVDMPAKIKACTDAGKPAPKLIVDEDQGKVTAGVVSGKSDAMLADSPIGLYAVQQTGGALEALGDIYDAAPYGFVVSKSETDFAQAIADALTAANASGAYTAALTKWGNASGAITKFEVNP